MNLRPVLALAATLLFLAAMPGPAAGEGSPEPGPERSGTLEGPFKPRGVHGWVADLPELEKLSDDPENPFRSTLILLEDGKLLREPHQLHLRIELIGQGGYSHWHKKVYFSTSDNTDPNTNGRTYSYRYTPPSWRFSLPKTVFSIFLLFLAGCLLCPLFLALGYRGTGAVRWLIGMGGWGLGLVLLLRANLIPPRTWYGAAFHALLLVLLVLSLLITWFVLHRAGRNRPGPGLALRIPKGWGLALALILGLEIFFRIVPIHSANHGQPAIKFFWPDLVHHPLNSYGFRDREPAEPKPGNLFRILVVGDSFVEGQGLSREEMFGRVMEREVNQRLSDSGGHGRVEVLSWGLCNKNAEENVATILNLPPEIDPDLVILEYTLWNDSETHPKTIKSAEPPAWFLNIRTLFIEELQSYLVFWLVNRVRILSPEHRSPMERLALRYREGFAGWEKAKAALGRLAHWLESSGADGFVLVFPQVQGAPDFSAPYQEVHLKVHRALDQYRLEYLDLIDLFQDRGVPGGNLVISRHDLHPNASANRMVGLHLAREISRRRSFQQWQKGLAR